MFVVALIALVVSAAALLFTGLNWWNSVKARRAAEDSATAASSSAEQAVASADAAQRSAAAAEEALGYAREDRATQRLAERTPRFEFGPIDWRGNVVARPATLRMASAQPPVELVEITLVGGEELGGYPGGPTGVPSVRWERPVQLEPFQIRFQRPKLPGGGYGPVIVRLRCTLTAQDDGGQRVIDLGPV